MTKKEFELSKKVGKMEGDIKSTVRAFYEILITLGIDLNDFMKEDDNVSDEEHAMSLAPTITKVLTKVSQSMLTGGDLSSKVVSKLKALGPILEEYRHLIDDLNIQS